jgi:hypothetical protein
VLNSALSHAIKCFAASKLVLNLDKKNIMKFITENSSHSTLCIGYKETYMEKAVNSEFLVLPINNLLNDKNDTEQIIPKLSGAMLCR